MILFSNRKRLRGFPSEISRRAAAAFVAILLTSLSLSAQKLPFAISNIRDGLVDSVVFAMMQDSQGFLWIGTRTGLSRFDGLEFVNYTMRDGLAHNVVRSMCEGPDGSLYFGTEHGVSCLKNGDFTTITDGLPSLSVRALVSGEDGSLWIGTYGGGLARWKNGRINIFAKKEGLLNGRIRSLLLAHDGSLWISTQGGGVARLKDGSITMLKEGLKDREIRSLWEDPGARIWVGTRVGAYRLEGDRFVLQLPRSPLSREAINVITSDSRGRVWFGTREAGAFVLEGGELRRFTTREGLADNSVTSILEDFEGNLWFGTYGGGICRLGGEKVLNWEATEGFPYPNVYGIEEDREGCMWFGTNGGGVSRYCKGVFTAFTTENGLPHNKVLSVFQAHDGAMWFGTLNGAVRQQGRNRQLIDVKKGLAHNVVYGIAEDSASRMYFATFGGLSILENGKIRTLKKSDGLAGNRINYLLFGKEGLWLATDAGLSLIRESEIQNWTSQDGLPSSFINHLLEDTSGVLWVASSLGLSRIKDGVISSWDSTDGLSNDNCTVILQGADEKLWIGTNRGVNIFDGNGFAIVSAREGLVSDLVNRGAGYTDHEGNLWFGTGGGVSRFAADFRPASLEPPPVHLLGVKVFDEDYRSSGEVRLNYLQNWLTFSYVALSFRRAQDIQYRYRLEGTGRPWQSTRLRQVQFSSLPPGHYSFEVTARIGQGEWNPSGAAFPFTIVPPVWRRWWFLTLLAGLFVALIWIRILGLRRRSRILEETVRERTAEIGKINNELRWLALNDRLTGLYNRHYVYQTMPVEVARLNRRRRQVLAAGMDEELPCIGMMLIDLDHFKEVNDKWDHMVGDETLRAVADTFRSALRDSDIVARWGGEEFLVILRDLYPSGIEEGPRRILKAIRSLKIDIDGRNSLSIRCSVGFSLFPQDVSLPEDFWESLVRVADLALLDAKRSGRDRAVGWLWPPDELDQQQIRLVLNGIRKGDISPLLRRVEINDA